MVKKLWVLEKSDKNDVRERLFLSLFDPGAVEGEEPEEDKKTNDDAEVEEEATAKANIYIHDESLFVLCISMENSYVTTTCRKKSYVLLVGLRILRWESSVPVHTQFHPTKLL